MYNTNFASRECKEMRAESPDKGQLCTKKAGFDLKSAF